MTKLSKISPKILVTGGGTGGHIYPAIAIADQIKRVLPAAQILFVGAETKMEMEKVPKAGYSILGLPIAGFDRSNKLSNVGFPMKLLKSLRKANKIISDFNPDIAIGTGGYASGPMLWAAGRKNIPYVIQEQNSFPGVTNKILKNKAVAICTAYEGITQFPAQKVHYTGNPIRSELFQNLPERNAAVEKFGLNPDLPVVFSMGGSQGARSINNTWLAELENLKKNQIQLIWQTGQLDFENIKNELGNNYPNIHATDFIYNMQDAYAAADVLVSRAGAMSISELSLIGKPAIFVPLPTAAEDHQTKNAMALVQKNAALLVPNVKVREDLFNTVNDLIQNIDLQQQLSSAIKKFGKPDATKDIVNIILENIRE